VGMLASAVSIGRVLPPLAGADAWEGQGNGDGFATHGETPILH
jgi:hypothetical protein